LLINRSFELIPGGNAMEFLWSFEALSALLRNKDPLVRGWATERMVTLYPESAGDKVIDLIDDKQEAVYLEAIDHFAAHSEPKYADKLLEAYKASSGMKAGMLAKAIVRLKDLRAFQTFREKYAVNPQEDLTGYALSLLSLSELRTDAAQKLAQESLRILDELKDPDHEGHPISQTIFTANLISGNDLIELFSFCHDHRDRPWLLATFLTALCKHCGGWGTEGDLTEEVARGRFNRPLPYVVEEAIESIEEKGLEQAARALRKKFKKGRHKDILRAIHEETQVLIENAKSRYGEDAYQAWLGRQGSAQRDIAALDAIYSNMALQTGITVDWTTRASLVIFSCLADYRPLIALDIEALDKEGLLGLFFQDRNDALEDERIMERLDAEQQSDQVIQACLEHVRNDPDSLANDRVVEFLSRRMNEIIAESLLEVETGNPGLWDSIPEVVTKLGAAALEFVPSLLADDDRLKWRYALGVLKELPMHGSVNLILEHWDKFWENEKELFLEALRNIGDAKFIPLLRKETKEGEAEEERLFYLLCFINNVTDSRLPRIKRELEEKEQRIRNLAKTSLKDTLAEPLNVELKCLRCNRSYHYDVEEVRIDGSSGDFHIVDPIRCKNCGSVDNYEVTSDGTMSVMARSILQLASEEEAGETEDRGPITYISGQRIDGVQMSLAEGLAYYERKLEKSPDHVSSLLGYANTLRMAKRTEEAVPIYQKILAQDPAAVEAYVSLAQIAEAKGALGDAHLYYEKASEFLHTGNYYRVAMELNDFKEAVLRRYGELSLQLGRNPRKPSIAAPAPTELKRIGRNAPCPCGSGKKYKKCCLPKLEQQKGSSD
jgi:predicted Zn-ribbon and HTH transcriptional regulator